MNSIASRLIAAGTLLLTSALAEERVTSEYTSTAKKQSLSYHAEKEGDGFTMVCKGLGAYQLVYTGGDARSWVNIKHGKTVVDLYGATMSAAGGRFPAKANDVVEWRGVHSRSGFQPYAIIYRITSNDEKTDRPFSRLLVIKLDGARSEIVGYAQGSNEDAKAKALADAQRPK
ncbi:MAG: hypothetical protein ABMA13_18310 [Chthoniobacteraceae bacterium]